MTALFLTVGCDKGNSVSDRYSNHSRGYEDSSGQDENDDDRPTNPSYMDIII